MNIKRPRITQTAILLTPIVAFAFGLAGCGPTPPASQSAPAKPGAPSVADLVDARGSSGEMELTNRGYTSAKTHGLTAYWWHPAGACVKVVTANGRYRTVEDVAASNCGHQGAETMPAKPGAPSVTDLKDARGSSGARELTHRGYTSAKTHGLTHYWWHPAGACVKVVTANGRYSVVENVAVSNCGH